VIRRATIDDADLVKETRLRMLADTPSAYATAYAEAAAFGDEVWRERLRPDRHPTFLSFDDEEVTGMVVGLIAGDRSAVQLASMWVAPGYRGSGVADELVQRVVAWAQDRGAATVRLAVTDGNERAERMYARHGFVRTGQVEVRERDGLVEIEMELDTSPDVPGAAADQPSSNA
jgi:ribosomal protein S18 acetylase RimI-like enzyme